MPDVSVVTTVITTAGALGGALGGIALTNWTGIRREERLAGRQRAEKQAEARQLAYADLLSASAQLRAHVEITCQQHWQDLNVRLSTAQDYAVTVGLHAARSALLSPGELADSARALGTASSRLVAWMAANARLDRDFSGPDERFLRGEIAGQPDFTQLDACSGAFLGLAAVSLSPGTDGAMATADR